MIDRLLGPRFVVITRIGRTEIGDSIITIDEHMLNVNVAESPGEQAIKVPLASIEEVVTSDEGIEVALRDGTVILFDTESAAALRDALLGRCRALPELTHALRAFGSRRGHRSTRAAAADDQRQFFEPLLEARRQAVAAATALAAMAAFDADALVQAIEARLSGFAVERYGDNAPARRALEAELIDLTEPLHVAFDALRDAAREASAATDDLRLWRAWTRQLRATFEVADRVWLSLDAALDADPWKL